MPAPIADPAAEARRWRRVAWIATALCGAAFAVVVLGLHPTPTYDVETDVLGTYVPAARALRAGRLDVASYAFHGVGYPALLALVGAPFGGNDWLAAKWLNLAAAVASSLLAFELLRRAWSERVAALATVALWATPAFAVAALQTGTDLPALSLALGATLLACEARSARALALGGALAGFAIVTRANAVYLPLAALVVLLADPQRRRGVLPYLAGVALPVGAWFALLARASHGAWSDENYANVAFEFYGRSVPWERFWLTTRGQFHSFADIVRYDPAAFAAHLARNLATRWWRDARELMWPGLGVLALPGLLLTLRSRAWAARLWPHLAGAYAILAFAFYAPRFSLVLLPAELAGAVAFVLWARWPHGGSAEPPHESRALANARLAVLALLVAGSAWTSVASLRRIAGVAPDETRVAGEWLRAHGASGAVLARKPHVAYFARLDYVALPPSPSLGALLRDARAAHARWLFVSAIEAAYRPPFAGLISGIAGIPGLELVQHGTPRERHPYALYRVTDEVASDAALDSVLLAASGGDAGGMAIARFALVGNLLRQGRAREAWTVLDSLRAETPDDALVARWQALAAAALGDYERAELECRRSAAALGRETSWERGHRGMALLMLNRLAEARASLEAAVADEPANAEYLDNLGVALYGLGERGAAERAFARVLALQPGHEEALYYATYLSLQRGDRDGAVERLAAARRRSAFGSRELNALADSLGVAAK